MRARKFAAVLVVLAGGALHLPGLPAQEPATGPTIELPADWQERDLEGRWGYYRRDLRLHPEDKDRQAAWGRTLAKAKELELLEWIGIFEGWYAAGPWLVQADAPQWIRVAVWNLRALDSHNKDTATQTLLAAGPRVLGWLEKYPLAKRGKAEALYAQLVDKNIQPIDPGDQLPPLDANQVLLPFLEVPGELQEFGNRRRAEPGVRYVHQVLRALRGLSVWGMVEELHVHKVLALTRHPDRQVRSGAFSALGSMPGHLVPHAALLAMAEGNENEGVEVRRLALLAASHSSHPAAWLRLHRIAATGGHPCQGVALERLAEVGNGFTVQYLQSIEGERLGFRGAAQARSVVSRIERRIGQKSEAVELVGFRRYVERAAWAAATGHPLADRLSAWTERALRNVLPGEDLAGMIDELEEAEAPPSPLSAEEAGRVAPVLRSLLRRLRGKER